MPGLCGMAMPFRMKDGEGGIGTLPGTNMRKGGGGPLGDHCPLMAACWGRRCGVDGADSADGAPCTARLPIERRRCTGQQERLISW